MTNYLNQCMNDTLCNNHLKMSLSAPLLFILFRPFVSRLAFGDKTRLFVSFFTYFFKDLSGRLRALSTK